MEQAFLVTRDCFTARRGDRIVAMFGVRDMERGQGAVWLLGTDELEDVAMPFLRLSKSWLLRLAAGGFHWLGNVVDIRNEVHIRYLKWLRFTFDPEPVKAGPFGMPFLRFHKEFPCVTR